jgi:hypothetical protein
MGHPEIPVLLSRSEAAAAHSAPPSVASCLTGGNPHIVPTLGDGAGASLNHSDVVGNGGGGAQPRRVASHGEVTATEGHQADRGEPGGDSEQDEDRGPNELLHRQGGRMGEWRDVQQRLGQLEQLPELPDDE